MKNELDLLRSARTARINNHITIVGVYFGYFLPYYFEGVKHQRVWYELQCFAQIQVFDVDLKRQHRCVHVACHGARLNQRRRGGYRDRLHLNRHFRGRRAVVGVRCIIRFYHHSCLCYK